MKAHCIKFAAQAASILALAAYGNLASAHNLTGSLPVALSGTDYWQVTCSGTAVSLLVRVGDQSANTSRVYATVQKGSTASPASALTTIDSTDTDAVAIGADLDLGITAGYGPSITVSQGTGTYNVIISHTAAATDNYNVQAHCLAAGGLHATTATSLKQNQ